MNSMPYSTTYASGDSDLRQNNEGSNTEFVSWPPSHSFVVTAAAALDMI